MGLNQFSPSPMRPPLTGDASLSMPNTGGGMLSFEQALTDASPAELLEIAQRFPEVECPFEPCGPYVTVQDMLSIEKTKSGIVLPDVSQDMAAYRQSIARVIRVGPTAGFDDVIGDLVPNWPWFAPGNFVKISQYSTTRSRGGKGKVVWRQMHWREIYAKISSAREVLSD